MHCKTSCSIALIFIITMVYFTMTKDETLHTNFYKTLNKDQINIYKNIVNERFNLYYTGFGLGILLAILFLVFNKYGMPKTYKLNKPSISCVILATSFVVQYFYYILSPKTTYMVLHLETKDQKQAWLDIYRKMQVNYHAGFALGLLGVTLLCYGV